MATEQPRPWVTRNGLALHAGLALPWAAEAAAVVLLAVSDNALDRVLLAALTAGATALALLLTRRWWLVLSALVGSIASVVGQVGLALNYIDHSPSGRTAQLALNATYLAFYVCLIASVAAIIIGVLEWRAARPRGGDSRGA